MKKDYPKWPLIVIGVIGILFLSLGIILYVKQQDLIGIAMALFMGLGFIYVLISEIIYRKKSKIIITEKQVPEKTIIKQSFETFLLNFLGNLVLAIFGGYIIVVLSEFNFQKLNFSFIFFLGLTFVIFYGKKSIENIYRQFFAQKKLALSNTGIYVKDEFFPWNEIKNQKIIEREEYSSKYKYMMKYFTFTSKGKLYEFKLEDYKIIDTELEQLLKTYRNRSSKNNIMNTKTNELESLLNFEEYLELSIEEGEIYLKKVRKIAEENRNELESYLINSPVNSTSQHSLIYSALSEEFPKWKTILSNEMIRLFNLAKNKNDNKAIFDALEEILPDECPDSEEVKKVAYFLYNELNHTDNKIRHKAIWYISFWVDEDNYQKFPEIINRIKEKLNDNHWKIRWMANNVLKDYPNINQQDIALNLWDRIRSKYGYPHTLD